MSDGIYLAMGRRTLFLSFPPQSSSGVFPSFLTLRGQLKASHGTQVLSELGTFGNF